MLFNFQKRISDLVRALQLQKVVCAPEGYHVLVQFGGFGFTQIKLCFFLTYTDNN